MKYHLRCRYTHMTLAGDKLRYENRIFSRVEARDQLSKVQECA